MIGRDAVRQSIETGQFATTAKTDKRDCFALTGFKADGGACRNIEAHAECRSPVEIERLIHFEEMIVRTDLHRTVAGIDDLKVFADGRRKARFAFGRDDCARLERIGRRAGLGRIGSWTVTSLVPSGKTPSTCRIGTMEATPDITSLCSVSSIQATSGPPRFALPRAFENLVGDDRDRLGMVRASVPWRAVFLPAPRRKKW